MAIRYTFTEAPDISYGWKRSEVDFAEDLNNTASDASSLEGSVRAGRRSCDRADGSKTATCDVRCRQGKVGMVEDVEGIRTDLEIQRFTVVHLLHQRDIGVCIVRSVELVSGRIVEVGLSVIGDEIGS